MYIDKPLLNFTTRLDELVSQLRTVAPFLRPMSTSVPSETVGLPPLDTASSWRSPVPPYTTRIERPP